MPPWVAFAPRSILCSRAKTIDRFSSSFRCRHVANPSAINFRVRSASTHVSPTAINYRPNVPPRNQELYDALSGLSGAAEQYANLSRLQLALRGLAVENAVTRVAVLGLDSQVGAQQLARLLIADPLAEKANWEQELEKSSQEGAVLLRFGDENDVHAPSPLYKILSVPSRVLGTHNLEILVSTVNVNTTSAATASATENSKDTVLVPKLQATHSARVPPVPYPVHKTLVLGEGLDSTIAYGRFTADTVKETENMIKVAIEIPAPPSALQAAEGSASTAVNIATATEGLDALRASVANSTVYERNWFASNLPTLTKWLTSDLQPADPIRPAQKALISSLLDDVEDIITKEDAQQLALLTSTTTSEQLGAEMIQYLEEWAEKSHRELRDSLDEAFAGKNWRKLAWWKLFWRVDDVGMITEEVIARRWLVSAEKDAVYLAGRMSQAGFPDEVRNLPVEVPPPSTIDATTPTATPDINITSPDATTFATSTDIPSLHPQPTALSATVSKPTPWPSLIPSTRATLLATTLPPLQTLAQHLILTTLSTTSLSAVLSALLYASISTVSLFEASAVAALGLTFSLRRMQRSWEDARMKWALDVREEGRQALKRTEGVVQMIVDMQGKGKVIGVEEEGVQERERARAAVARVREALGRMGEKARVRDAVERARK